MNMGIQIQKKLELDSRFRGNDKRMEGVWIPALAARSAWQNENDKKWERE